MLRRETTRSYIVPLDACIRNLETHKTAFNKYKINIQRMRLVFRYGYFRKFEMYLNVLFLLYS